MAASEEEHPVSHPGGQVQVSTHVASFPRIPRRADTREKDSRKPTPAHAYREERYVNIDKRNITCYTVHVCR